MTLNMTLSDLSVIVATLLGPIFAVQIQKSLESWRDDNERRLQIFKTLMSTRGAALSQGHVQALNSIELEFQGEKFKGVRTTWRIYRDHLNNIPQGYPSPDQSLLQNWCDKLPDLLSNLLTAMGSALGYSFDSVDIINTAIKHRMS
jgi:hypothetical protein